MNPIILALDLHSMDEARDLLTKTRDHIGMIKIGPELWSEAGPTSLELGKEFNIPIFLDLKLNDIPNTVSKTIDNILAQATLRGADITFMSVYAFGGREMIKAALGATRGKSRLAVVTILTSLVRQDMVDFGFRNAQEGIRTVDLADFAQRAGADTFVCSPCQIDLMRKHYKDKITLICPGIRAESDPEDDQKRTKPASFALRQGKADYIVIGRPITQNPSPDVAAKQFHDSAIKAGR